MEAYRNIPVDGNLQELRQHGSRDFPMQIYLESLEEYEQGHVAWHWHSEIELVLVLTGRIDFYCGDQDSVQRLCPGEAFFANANVLHMLRPGEAGHNSLFSLVMDPMLIGGHEKSLISEKYIRPITESRDVTGVFFPDGAPWQRAVIGHLANMDAAFRQKPFGYEVTLRNEVSALWLHLAENLPSLPGAGKTPALGQDDRRIKLMMQFIQQYYAEPITLGQIAAAAGISESECCRCFSRVLDTRPFRYLAQVRLDVAARMLLQTDMPVTAVATACGFSSPSYFGRQFALRFGCAPSQYRKSRFSPAPL